VPLRQGLCSPRQRPSASHNLRSPRRARKGLYGAEQWIPWTQHYQRDEWLELLRSYSEYAALEPNLRHRLLDAIGTTIDDYGGLFVMNFETVLIAATRLG
jgi:hypothetical protein